MSSKVTRICSPILARLLLH